MPLFEMSSNIQESEAASRKRSHDQFSEPTVKLEDSAAENITSIKPEDAEVINGSLQDIPSTSITAHDIKRERSSSPTLSSDSELSFRGSPSPMPMDDTPSTSPMAPGHTDSQTTSTKGSDPSPSSAPVSSTQAQPAKNSALASTSTPSSAPPKKKRKTAAEKEAEERERALKKAKKEEELAAKAKEKEEKEAAKIAKAAEKAAEKAKAAAEKAKTAAEKAKIAAEKEEKERKKKEEEDKKKRAQPSIFGFLKTKPAVLGDVSPNKQLSSTAIDSSPVRPKVSVPISAIATPSTEEVKSEKSAYEKLFQPFYIKTDVKMAPVPFQMDEEAMLAKSKILDEYVKGERGNVTTKPFDPVSVFQFSGVPTKRGKQHLAVKKVMAEIFGDPLDSAPNNRTESQQVRFTSVQDQLNSIPVKVLSFWEDVRPPYVGTITSTSEVKLQKLARRPTGRLLKLNYDYDSEAEWEEEEGEDLDDEEVEDEENEADEEMGDFLDDAEDVAAARPAFLGDSEPVSTGICYEDHTRRAHNIDGEDCATVYKYRMEFLLESLDHHHSIDPFSTEYWQPKVAPVPTTSAQSKITSVIKATSKPTASMAPPPAPGSSTTPAQPDWTTLVPKATLPDFKRALVSADINFLTKVGIVDMLSKRFPTVTKNQVRATLDFVAERSAVPGAKKSAKVWVLRPEHALDKN